jgi:hypothetical protein
VAREEVLGTTRRTAGPASARERQRGGPRHRHVPREEVQCIAGSALAEQGICSTRARRGEGSGRTQRGVGVGRRPPTTLSHGALEERRQRLGVVGSLHGCAVGRKYRLGEGWKRDKVNVGPITDTCRLDDAGDAHAAILGLKLSVFLYFMLSKKDIMWSFILRKK